MTACNSAPSGNSAAPSTKINIGVDTSQAPFVSVDTETNELVGLDIELLRTIAVKANFDLNFISVRTNQLIPLVASCQLDAAVSAIPLDDQLEQPIIFSLPYYTASQVVVVKKGNLTVAGRNTLAKMTVGAQAGSPSQSEVSRIPSVDLKTYPYLYLMFNDLITGYIDAVIVEKPRALDYVQTKPNNLKIVGDEFGKVEYAIALCASKPNLIAQINPALAALKGDGTLARLANKWVK